MKGVVLPGRTPKTEPDLWSNSKPSPCVTHTCLNYKTKPNGDNELGKTNRSGRYGRKNLEAKIMRREIGGHCDRVYQEEQNEQNWRAQPEISDMLKTFDEMRLDCQLWCKLFRPRDQVFSPQGNALFLKPVVPLPFVQSRQRGRITYCPWEFRP